MENVNVEEIVAVEMSVNAKNPAAKSVIAQRNN